MAQKVVALDISGDHARLVTVETTFRAASLTQARVIDFGENAEEADKWQQIRDAMPDSVDSLIMATVAKSASTRLVEFPFGDMRKIEAAIEFELESQIPYAIEDVATTWDVVERTSKSARTLAALTPREPLLDYLERLSEADIEPRAIVLPSATLAELAPVDAEGTFAVLAAGDSESHLAIHGGTLRFARTLRAGGVDVDRLLAERFKISVEEACHAKTKEGRIIPDGEPATEEETALSETLKAGTLPLIRAITTTFRSLPASDAPTKLYLTGGLSQLPGFAGFLEERLGIEVALLELSEVIEPMTCEVPDLSADYGVCVAMALALLRRGRQVPLNFRRGDLAYVGDFQQYRSDIMRVGIGIAAVLVFAMISSMVKLSLVASEEERVNRGFCEATKKIVGREICDPIAALATMKQTPNDVSGVQIPDYSAAALFEVMSRSIDKDLDVTFSNLEFRVEGRTDEADRINGKGEADSFETTELLVQKIQADPCVTKAEVSKQRKSGNKGRVEFSFNAEVQCPPGTLPGAHLEKLAGTPVNARSPIVRRSP